MALRYLDGAPCDGKVTDSDMAREPRSEALIAWFDGWAAGGGQGPRGHVYPRRLTHAEQQAWRDGHREGLTERRRHDAHGFGPCDCPDRRHAP